MQKHHIKQHNRDEIEMHNIINQGNKVDHASLNTDLLKTLNGRIVETVTGIMHYGNSVAYSTVYSA